MGTLETASPNRFSSNQEDTGTSLSENQIYDYITNTPVKDTPIERAIQAVARSLVEEYGFDHIQMQRDQIFANPVLDEHGKSCKVLRKLNVVVYPENVPKDDPAQITRLCLVQAPNVKATDRKRGVALLEEVMGALPACEYGLWTNGTDLVFKEKLTGDGRIQPEYADRYDLPGYGETAVSLDNPKRQAVRIATGDNLQRTFARVHDYIYGNQGLKKDAAFWQVLNLIFCKIHDEPTPGVRRFWVKGTERNTPEGQAAIAERIKALFPLRSTECGTWIMGFILALVAQIPVPMVGEGLQEEVGNQVYEAYESRAEAFSLKDNAQALLGEALWIEIAA